VVLGFTGSEDIITNANREDYVLHAADPVPSNTPLQQVTGSVIEMEGSGKRNTGMKLSSEQWQQQLIISQLVGRQVHVTATVNDICSCTNPRTYYTISLSLSLPHTRINLASKSAEEKTAGKKHAVKKG